MPFAPEIQILINRNIITAQQAAEFAAHFSPTVVKALGTDELARELQNRVTTLSSEQLRVIMAIKARYVRRAMHHLHVIHLVLNNLLTLPMIQKITTPELYEYLFNHSIARAFQNGTITPEFFEYIADPFLLRVVSNPTVKGFMLQGFRFGVPEFENLRLLINQAQLDSRDIHFLLSKAQNLRWYVSSTRQCTLLAHLLKNNIMPKHVFLNEDEYIVKALFNRWIGYLLESGKMTFDEFLDCLDEYLEAYDNNDPLRHARITNALVKSKLSEQVKPTVSDIDTIIIAFGPLQEFLTQFPETRDEFIMTILSSNYLFDKFITTQQRYDILRGFFSQNLPAPFGQITREADLANARQARLHFHQEINICHAAFWLAKGQREERSTLYPYSFDALAVIAAQAGYHEQGLCREQRVAIANTALLHYSQPGFPTLFGFPAQRAPVAPRAAAMEDSNPPRPN